MVYVSWNYGDMIAQIIYVLGFECCLLPPSAVYELDSEMCIGSYPPCLRLTQSSMLTTLFLFNSLLLVVKKKQLKNQCVILFNLTSRNARYCNI